jgi:hypothetical protein
VFRRLLRRWAELHGMGDQDADDVVIAVSEAVANALQHRAPPVRVRAWADAGLARVHVHDRGRAPIPATAGYHPPNQESEADTGSGSPVNSPTSSPPVQITAGQLSPSTSPAPLTGSNIHPQHPRSPPQTATGTGGSVGGDEWAVGGEYLLDDTRGVRRGGSGVNRAPAGAAAHDPTADARTASTSPMHRPGMTRHRASGAE